MDFNEYIDYFETKAGRNHAIAHNAETHKAFAQLDFEEAVSAVKTGLKYPCMILETPDMGLSDAGDNPRNIAMSSFYILKNISANASVLDMRALRQLTYSISKQVVQAMRNDRRNRVLTQLDAGSFKWFKAGPMLDNAYGWEVQFTLNEPISLELDESDWDDETRAE